MTHVFDERCDRIPGPFFMFLCCQRPAPNLPDTRVPVNIVDKNPG